MYCMRVCLGSCLVSVLAVSVAAGSGARGAEPVDFTQEIRPLLSARCLNCHGPDDASREAGLRLDRRDDALRVLDSGSRAIVPGDPAASELIVRVASDDPDLRMPPSGSGKPLTPQEIAVLRRWIEQGAAYEGHWAWRPPQAATPPVPPAEFADWPENEIDRFVLKRMLEHGLQPSERADRYALVRRVFLDLTGLPPTVEEADAWVNCSDPDAWDRLVDDLLHRDAYGEHWARKWLDLARYADSAGYADDPPRTIWAWRDWVIRAINSNMPFDQFTIEQLAGDLLPDATEDQIIATAFHRNTMTNSEGGTVDEQWRNAAVVDRVNTTFSVWMGTTMACAQCHSHKYDPISQTEYFQVFAILNNTQDADRRDEAPVLELYSPEQKERRRALQQQIARLKSEASDSEHAAERLQKLEKELQDIQPETTVPVLRELTENRRVTRLQYRGDWQSTGPEVQAGVPSAFHDLPGDRPPDRLALARWLVDENNPLTARVAVNRFWEALFGRGLVATSEDFGSQGALPTHPDLLDWLAVEFMRSGWDRRELLRRIVTSATYRQSARVTPEHLAADPDNRWLARAPRVRLSAEMVRDQALAVSGLLSRRLYGPPVRPPQPSLGLRAAFGSSTDWETSTGEDRYRRAIYTLWRRSNPYPSMATFDAPTRESCTIRRNRTNTPLQALVTLNDPVFIETAQALARRAQQHAETPDEQIRFAFRCCLLRPPTDTELTVLQELFEDALQQLVEQPQEAEQLATDPLGPLPDHLDVSRTAAMTVVSNVLLNLDEMFLKR